MSSTTDTAPKVRVRLGIRLTWPIANAATFVFYVPETTYQTGATAVANLHVWLLAVNQTEIAKRLIFERS